MQTIINAWRFFCIFLFFTLNMRYGTIWLYIAVFAGYDRLQA